MRGRLTLAVAAVALIGASAPPPTVAGQRAALRAARAASRAADARAVALERAADAERDDALKAQGREAAVAARIRAAEADIAAGQARVALTERALAAGRVRLAERQAPIARLVAALQSLARRPAAVAVVQPGTAEDIVRVRAVLGTLMPVVRARSAGVRAELSRATALRADADAAVRSLAAGRARLQGERLALVRLQSDHRLRSEDLDRSALVESDRAIALGERARDLVAGMEITADAAETRARLAALAGPLPRPERIGGVEERAPTRFGTAPYRLPVRGRVVEGLGEVSPTGVRARGLTLATTAGAAVVAPAAGRIVFARPFRDYGTVVIVDHGGGWSSAITGLDAVSVAVGDAVTAGAPIGRVGMRDDPRIAVELRRRGVAVDLAQLLG